MKAKKLKKTSSEKKAAPVQTRVVLERRKKVEKAAKDFAVRFEGVMRELANG
jgi:hypothetical protein